MYKIPADLNLSFLIGKEITQLNVSRYVVVFKFDPQGSIAIESEFEIIEGSNKIMWNQEVSQLDLPIKTLFQSKIVDYKVESEQCLVIILENDLSIRIFDHSEQYESFQIDDGEGNIYII